MISQRCRKLLLTWQNANGDFRLSQIENLKSAGGANLSRFAYGYTPSGRIATWEQALGTSASQEYSFTYDPIDQLMGAVLGDKASGDELASFSYGYDKAMNRSSAFRKRKVIVGDRQDQHNNLNQVTVSNRQGKTHVRGRVDEGASVSVNGKAAQLDSDHSFDAWLDLPAGEQTISVSATDEQGNVGNASWDIYNDEVDNYNLTYDAAGNLLGDPAYAGRTFEWDARNRLTAIQTGDHRSEFSYDSLDRRIRIVEKDRINSGAPWTETSNETYLWVGSSLAEKRDATGGTVRVRYLGAGEQRIGGTDAGLYYYTRDHLGSVRELVDASGNVRARYDYGLWGRQEKIEGDLEAEFGFTGHHVHSETGLHLALYRVYDAKMGRWLSADPIAEDGGLNLYAYVGNDPVNGLDPLGLKDYSLDEVEVIKAKVLLDATAGPIAGIWNMASNHSSFGRYEQGKYDYKLHERFSTFEISPGNYVHAGHFGNYLAAYAGSGYDLVYEGQPLGIANMAVFYGGIVYDFIDLENETWFDGDGSRLQMADGIIDLLQQAGRDDILEAIIDIANLLNWLGGCD